MYIQNHFPQPHSNKEQTRHNRPEARNWESHSKLWMYLEVQEGWKHSNEEIAV